MSGIYIPGTEMPKDGSFEVFVVHDNGIVAKGFFPNENEFTNAIFIPDHGRLIDADALKDSIICDDTDEHKILSTRKLHHELDQWIDERPTIIPADKGGADDV